MKNIFIASSLLFVSLTLFSQKHEGKVVDQIIGVIGTEIVLQSEIEGQIAALKAQGVSVDKEAGCELFEQLLFQRLLVHQAAVDSVTVSSDQVETEIDRRLAYFISQIGSEKELEKYYKKSISEIKEEFRRMIKDQLVAQRMQGEITANVTVTPNEVKKYFNELHTDSVPLVDAQMRIAQVFIEAKVSRDDELAAKEKLNEFKRRVEEGESFKTLAVLYSEDEGSAKKGGELGFMGKAELVPEFSKVAFKLKKNEMSHVVKSAFGFHLIQMIERRGTKVNVRHILIRPQISESQLAIAKKKIDSINVMMKDTLTFEKAVAKYSEDEKTKMSGGILLNPMNGLSVFKTDELDPALFYVVDKLNKGEVSEPFPVKTFDGKQGYRIVKLLDKTAPHKATLETDYNKIKEAALVAIQNDYVEEWINEKVQRTFIRINGDYNQCQLSKRWTVQ